MRPRFLLLTFPLLFAPLVFAHFYNVTIDDQMGDPTTGRAITYTPIGAWDNGQACDTCSSIPSPASMAYMSTWKNGTFFPAGSNSDYAGEILTASVAFVGTAVYVQCILTGSKGAPDGIADMTFKIDNQTVGSYLEAPSGDNAYRFGVTVFSASGLSNVAHALTLESGNAGRKALVLLDSIIYTKHDDDSSSSLESMVYTPSSTSLSASSSASASPSSSSSSNTTVIASCVVGGIVAVTAILAVAFLCHRRQRRSGGGVRVMIDASDTPSTMSPFPHSTYPHYPSHPEPAILGTTFDLRPPNPPTLSPGDSVSQVSSDRTSDWTTVIDGASRRPTFRERARAFAISRQRVGTPSMKVQNVTDADLGELDENGMMKPPAYIPSRLGAFAEKEKS